MNKANIEQDNTAKHIHSGKREKQQKAQQKTQKCVGKLTFYNGYSLVIDELGTDYVVSHFEDNGVCEQRVECALFRDQYNRTFFRRGCRRYYLSSFLYF